MDRLSSNDEEDYSGKKLLRNPLHRFKLGTWRCSIESSSKYRVKGYRTICSQTIIQEIADEYEIPERAIAAGSSRKAAVAARSAACRIALEEGYSAAEVARYLGLSRYEVVVAGRRDIVQAGPLLDGNLSSYLI